MKLHVSELEGGIRLIALDGKLDSSGVYAVEMDFQHHCVGDRRRILVDISNVSYISSIGIPMLVNTAKLVNGKGGRMALLALQDPEDSSRVAAARQQAARPEVEDVAEVRVVADVDQRGGAVL